MRWFCNALVLTSFVAPAYGQQQMSPAVARYIKVPAAPVIMLEHVRVIDGTGAAALVDQTVTLKENKIASVEAAGQAKVPAGAVVLDLTGRTVLPGLVGMHDHMYYIARPNLDAVGTSEPPLVVPQMTYSSPHLY